MDARLSMSSEARVPTSVPRRYLLQLGKHFQHKRPVTLTEDHGRIEFPGGVCVLHAEAAALVLGVSAGDEATLGTLDVIARHLLRFAFREAPEIRGARTADGSVHHC